MPETLEEYSQYYKEEKTWPQLLWAIYHTFAWVLAAFLGIITVFYIIILFIAFSGM